MSNLKDEYRRQIELLEALASKLVGFQSQADEARKQYRNELNSAEDSGFMKDYTQILGGGKFESFSKHIDSLLDTIEKCRNEVSYQKPILQDLKDTAGTVGSET